MRVKTYGTRGSTPIARRDSVDVGGNTTSLRVFSDCIPKDTALIVDTGTGYFEASKDILKEGIYNVSILFTHWHPDHTNGVLLAPHTFIPTAKIKVWGPKEHNVGVAEVLGGLMTAPVFPVEWARLRHRFNCANLEHVGTQVLVIHPQGGFHLLPVHVFEKAQVEKMQVSLGKARYPIDECLIVRMRKTEHPEYTISYRFEERPTGKVFVFLTDHENTASMPADLRSHVSGADLLIQDAQYSAERYAKQTAGFGHGTPEYCAETMVIAGAKRLGLTHHDPNASDSDVAQRLQEARTHVSKNLDHPELTDHIFACKDYEEIDLMA